ncbi:MAG TPA: hypothetical protein VKB16_02670 [Beijerinckiaceae bacterium]|jgi:hypothetical protein|nr:hypothetical protein [Beijerinckiaceae bacterium]
MSTVPDPSAGETRIIDFFQARQRRITRPRAARPFADKVEDAKRAVLRKAGLLFVLDPKPLDATGLDASR